MFRRVLVIAVFAALVLAAPAAAAGQGSSHKQGKHSAVKDRNGSHERKNDSQKGKTLPYKRARNAFQAKADSLAATPTTVTAFKRLGPKKFVGTATWQQVNPHGCRACAYDPVKGFFVDTPTIDDWWTNIYVIQRSSGELYVKIHSFGTT